MKKTNVIIIGAGPAGLTAGYLLLRYNSKKYNVVILEKSSTVGGISKTINYNNNRMDLGGHRFFTKDEKVFNLWCDVLKVQGVGSIDDKILNNNSNLFVNGGPDPDEVDKVFLVRRRVSRIYYLNKFFDYPISLNLKTIYNLGFVKTVKAGFSYIKALIFKQKETNLENFYINRFGKFLYSIFFKGYTEKLWGRSPKDISASWGSQRVKGISVKEVINDWFNRVFKLSKKSNEVSLTQEFYYPKFGPGQMWDCFRDEIVRMGGKVITNCDVCHINNKGNNIDSVVADNAEEIKGDIFISSIPIDNLINGMKRVPKRVKYIASNLPYRDFITVGLVVDKLKVKNATKLKTINDIIPDCWIYVQSTDFNIGRIQVFNNWSPYMVCDYNNTVSLGLEFFCNKGDKLWLMNDSLIKHLAISELIRMGILDCDVKIINYHVERVEKAYPAYFDTYEHFEEVKNYLNKYDNLYCIGRNGQHRYNNMDHSMETAMECVYNIINNKKDKDNVWNVNLSREYHERK